MKYISFISQSGNVLKSTLAQAAGVELAKNGLNVAIADLDIEHRTTTDWMEQREEFEITPIFKVYEIGSARESLECFNDEDIAIIDAPSRATEATKTVALNSDLVVQPTTPSKKDMDLALKTFYDLAEAGVDPKKMIIVFTRVGTEGQLQRATEYLSQAEINGQEIRILPKVIWEKVGYGDAVIDGYSITETKFQSLNDKSEATINKILTLLI